MHCSHGISLSKNSRVRSRCSVSDKRKLAEHLGEHGHARAVVEARDLCDGVGVRDAVADGDARHGERLAKRAHHHEVAMLGHEAHHALAAQRELDGALVHHHPAARVQVGAQGGLGQEAARRIARIGQHGRVEADAAALGGRRSGTTNRPDPRSPPRDALRCRPPARTLPDPAQPRPRCRAGRSARRRAPCRPQSTRRGRSPRKARTCARARRAAHAPRDRRVVQLARGQRVPSMARMNDGGVPRGFAVPREVDPL